MPGWSGISLTAASGLRDGSPAACRLPHSNPTRDTNYPQAGFPSRRIRASGTAVPQHKAGELESHAQATLWLASSANFFKICSERDSNPHGIAPKRF